MTAEVGTRAGRREWIGLLVLALPTLLIAMDMTVLYLAAPKLAADLQVSGAELLWITDIYGFVIAGMLVPAGALGDRIGRRKLLLIGAALFGAASVLAAYAPSAELLIAARALLGAAGATLMPSTLSLVRVMFADAGQRAFAVAVVMTSFSVGTTVGPLLGGLLLNHFWWGSVFLLGVPVMLLLLALGPVLLPEYRDPAGGRVDLASAALLLVALLSVVYAIKRVAESGFDAVVVIAAVVGVALGILFARRQNRLDDPLLDLALLRDKVINTSLGTYLLGLLVMGGTQLFIALYLQEVLGLSPLAAGAWMVPASVGTIVGSLAAPVLARRFRPGIVVTASVAVAAAGFAIIAQTKVDDLPVLMTGYVVVALGLSPMIALCTDLVVSAAPAHRAGAASALSESSGELGVALGVAVLGSLGTAVYRAELGTPEGVDPEAVASPGGVRETAAGLPAETGAPLLEAAREALSSGLAATAWAAAGIGAVTALVTLRLRAVPRIGERA
ncbi:MFS transporter [Saccharopolyspora sp. 5N708]|uniref:MFS transporter n=1 Tax=Saccharopolyspora sp. 5N708 TaxID=3457424 RepID=UPI003FD27707